MVVCSFFFVLVLLLFFVFVLFFPLIQRTSIGIVTYSKLIGFQCYIFIVAVVFDQTPVLCCDVVISALLFLQTVEMPTYSGRTQPSILPHPIKVNGMILQGT